MVSAFQNPTKKQAPAEEPVQQIGKSDFADSLKTFEGIRKKMGLDEKSFRMKLEKNCVVFEIVGQDGTQSRALAPGKLPIYSKIGLESMDPQNCFINISDNTTKPNAFGQRPPRNEITVRRYMNTVGISLHKEHHVEEFSDVHIR